MRVISYVKIKFLQLKIFLRTIIFLEGAFFREKNWKSCQPFFRPTSLVFQYLRKYYKDPIVSNFPRQKQVFERKKWRFEQKKLTKKSSKGAFKIFYYVD